MTGTPPRAGPSRYGRAVQGSSFGLTARASRVVLRKAHFCGDGQVDTAFGEQFDFGAQNGRPVDGGGHTCALCGTDCSIVVDC